MKIIKLLKIIKINNIRKIYIYISFFSNIIFTSDYFYQQTKRTTLVKKMKYIS